MRCQERLFQRISLRKKIYMWEIFARTENAPPPPPHPLTILTVSRKGEEMSTDSRIRVVKRWTWIAIPLVVTERQICRAIH